MHDDAYVYIGMQATGMYDNQEGFDFRVLTFPLEALLEVVSEQKALQTGLEQLPLHRFKPATPGNMY